MITDNLTNTVLFSDLLPKKCPTLNQHISETMEAKGIRYAYLSETKDIWCRDFMPIQIAEDRFVFYKYTPDYLQDKTGLRLRSNPEKVFFVNSNQLMWELPMTLKTEMLFDGLRPIPVTKMVFSPTRMDLIMDGGNVVKCGNTIVMTEKVFFENKDKTRAEVEGILKDTLQSDILFLPWDRKEIFGHSDGIVHYAGNGRILLTNYDDFSPYYYNRFRKALEKHFDVIPLKYEAKRQHARSWSYINFLQVGKLVLVPQLGLEEDGQALEQIGIALPDCEVVGIPSLEAVRRGGALNCISWNIKV